MSEKHPIIAVTGSSGAGTSTVKRSFEHIFAREGVKPVVVEGDSYHKYNRVEMREAMAKATAEGKNMSLKENDIFFENLLESEEAYKEAVADGMIVPEWIGSFHNMKVIKK